MRVYLPSTLPRIRGLVTSGTVGHAPLHGFAVTDELRSTVEGDEEELEYEAFSAAASESIRLLAADSQAPRRRAVLAVEVAESIVRRDSAAGSAGVTVTAEIPLKRVAAAHVDAPEAAPVVTEALPTFDESELAEHDLLWFATQELGYIEE